MSQDQKLMAAAAELDKALTSEPAVASLESAALAGVDPKELCKLYRNAKPFIVGAIKLIELLPWGGPVAKAVRLLMQIADTLCPVA
jgi:hypothetical protein